MFYFWFFPPWMCVLNPLPPLISISSCPHPLVSLHMFSHAPLFCLQLLPLCEYQNHFWPLLESAFWHVQLPGEFSHSNTMPYLCLKQISFDPGNVSLLTSLFEHPILRNSNLSLSPLSGFPMFSQWSRLHGFYFFSATCSHFLLSTSTETSCSPSLTLL